ncbi:MAG: DUF222 domain-containing protein [Polyangiales bacterium]
MEAASPSTITLHAGHALGEQIAEQAAHLDAATHRLLTDLRAFDESGAWYAQGFQSCAKWLSWRLGWDGGRARDHVRIAKRLGELPLIDDALRRGQLSYCKVRAMTRVATPANEALLLVDATYSTGTQLEAICRKFASVHRATRRHHEEHKVVRTVTTRDRDDGMVTLSAVLHPDEAALVWEALTKIAREREARFCRADALVDLAQQVVRGTSVQRSPTELVVTIAAEALAGDDVALPVALIEDGTVVSAETAQRLACDCGVVEIHEDADGTPLSVGRKTRSIPTSLKRALLRRDQCCRFPGCSNRVFLEGHHVQHWAHGGETALSNLVATCSYHHRFVHEYGYRVEMLDGAPQFFNPLGFVVRAVPEPPRPSDLGWATLLRMNKPLDITPATNTPRWDGAPVNYDWVVEDLCRLDPPG